VAAHHSIRPASRRSPILLAAAGSALAVVLAGCGGGTVVSTAPSTSATPTPATASSPPSTTSEPSESGADTAAHAIVSWEHDGISLGDLEASTQARWFFGHQSVGGNVLKGIGAMYRGNGLGRANLVNVADGEALPESGGVIAHAPVGRNGYPLEKLADFDAILRAGTAAEIDTAVLKFCYTDVRAARTDIPALFEEYRRVMADLERDFPEVRFVYATVPLRVEGEADNVARTELNAMIRAEYAGTGRLWDIAAIEATTLDGEQVGGTFEGQPYQALNADFSHDGSHLFETGTEVAAAPLLELVVHGRIG
jgi:hypothetical protein